MGKKSTDAKAFMFHCLEVLGQKASNMVANAQQKLNEMNLEARRREIMTEFPNRALELWKQGTSLPEELTELLYELTEVDQKLMILKAQKYSNINEEKADSQISSTESEQIEETKCPADAPSEDTVEEPADVSIADHSTNEEMYKDITAD